jgi:hypothetical protein
VIMKTWNSIMVSTHKHGRISLENVIQEEVLIT